MQNWLPSTISVLVVFIGWWLSQVAVIKEKRRLENKKLNKALYYTLDLYYILKKEKTITESFPVILKSLYEKIGVPESAALQDSYIYFFTEAVKNAFKDPDKIELLESNLDKIFDEVSEFYPVFIHELNGQHKVKEKLKKFDELIKQLDAMSTGSVSSFIAKLNQIIPDALIEKLEELIRKIATKINKQTLKECNDRIKEIAKDSKADDEIFVDKAIQFMRKANLVP